MSIGEGDGNEFGSVESLGAAGHLQRPSRWCRSEVGSWTEAFWSQHINTHAIADIPMSETFM